MAEIKLEGSSLECRNWLKDCLKVFQHVMRMRIEITCSYKELPKSVLARTNGRVTVNRDVDAESLLLKGTSNAKLRRVLHRSFSIEVNAMVKNIENERLKEQVVKNVLVHELMHIERKDILELSKSYRRRRRKKIHAGLEDEAFKRYNELRAIEGLPKVARKRDLDKAVSKVFERAG